MALPLSISSREDHDVMEENLQVLPRSLRNGSYGVHFQAMTASNQGGTSDEGYIL